MQRKTKFGVEKNHQIKKTPNLRNRDYAIGY